MKNPYAHLGIRDAELETARRLIADEPTICEWFALCDHVATQTRPHPVLGDVPICDRCAAKLDALS